MISTDLLEQNRPTILKHLREQYEANCELCGDDSDEADEAKRLYKKVLANPIEKCRDEILHYYKEMYYAVGGYIEEYYSPDTSLIEMIQKLIVEDAI